MNLLVLTYSGQVPTFNLSDIYCDTVLKCYSYGNVRFYVYIPVLQVTNSEQNML